MESIRKLQFMVKGYRNFTKRNKKLPELQGSLKGYNFVITGANSGIGLTAAINAAQKGAQVYIICRNQQRGNEAVIKIKQKSKNQNVSLILGEMNEKKDLEGIFNRLKQKLKRIDILVHNAGCMLHKRQFNNDKIQKNYACNTFSIFYLTHLCLPLLHNKSKIITVSSGGMLTQKLQTVDLFMEKIEFDGTAQYARNKRQQICIMEEFAKLYPNKGKFVAMHPGWVDTLAVRTSMPDFYNKMKDDLKDEEEGADTILYLSLLDFDKIKNGEFYYDRQVVDKHLTISCTTYEPKEAEKMMNILRKQAEIE